MFAAGPDKHHAVIAMYPPPDEFQGSREVPTTGLPDGVGEPADPLVAHAVMFRRLQARALRNRAERQAIRNSPASAGFNTARRRCSTLSPMSSAILNSCRCAFAEDTSTPPGPDGTEVVIADMTVSFKAGARSLHAAG